ncbi:beta-1,6-N-acetylglucosaminyltransferase [Massilia sp. G4R7]|uniref:Peptide O-xylosyltransferase n=1 Tax=Massilia phyllostachyos TaxID=2898585 RepID=A0ABS8QAW7_9BURK|nr:beta-1,6-N-acetylglucosaminyltransferase [Massilia phyllostachyos]MCD2518886.1 beta-1,6-N-acetylglucosaminyltransferase [Massilia phyllostachyos]
MKQVFLIAAHKDVEQLNALVKQLNDPDFVVYVHLDRKSAIDPADLHPAARLVEPRVDVRWGGFSQVQATLTSLRQILLEQPAFDKVIFLSAQDFPLLPNALLKRELARVRERELIETTPIGPDGWNVAYRYQLFHRVGGSVPERLACGAANALLRLTGRRRRLPDGLAPHGGSSWWALSRGCVAEVLRLADAHPRFLRLCRTVQCPDELFFQTLVMHSSYAPRVLSDNYRYVQWPEQGARNPKVLDGADFERIRASNAHFCRKLDSQASAALMQRLVAWKDARAA